VEAEDEVPENPVAVEGPANEADTVQDGRKLQDEDRAIKGKLIEVEARAEGRVSWLTYVTYIRAAGTISWILTILLMLLIRAINIGNQVTCDCLLIYSSFNGLIVRYSLPDGVLHIISQDTLTPPSPQ
jgi:hypothetical protein